MIKLFFCHRTRKKNLEMRVLLAERDLEETRTAINQDRARLEEAALAEREAARVRAARRAFMAELKRRREEHRQRGPN